MWTEYQSKIHHPQPQCRVSVVCTVDIGYSATNTGVVPPMSKLDCWNCHWVNNVSCFCCNRMAAQAHQLEKQLTRNQKQAEIKWCSSNPLYCKLDYYLSSTTLVTQLQATSDTHFAQKFAIDNCPITPSAFEGFEPQWRHRPRPWVKVTSAQSKGGNLRHVYVPSLLTPLPHTVPHCKSVPHNGMQVASYSAIIWAPFSALIGSKGEEGQWQWEGFECRGVVGLPNSVGSG